MIFGRKKQTARLEQDEVSAVEDVEQEELSEADAARAEAEAQWQAWDDEFDREEGPFDIDEVDLGADEEKRIDLGSLVITPFEGMSLQISVNQQQVPQAIIVSDGKSAIEVALFGGPSRSSYLPEVRNEIIAATGQQAGSKLTVRRGPFGTELARVIPVTREDGQKAVQVSRTWLVEGPSWILRGVVLGKAALEPDNEEANLALSEFFANLVVRRGSSPVAAGAVIPFTLPELGEAEA